MAQTFSLYVHVPFCERKCTYCDFNSYAGQESLIRPYANAVAQEAALWAPLLRGRPVETVFFGGGTPSLLPLDPLSAIVDALRRGFDIDPDAETTLEANPATVDLDYLRGLRDLGFNRLSFGVQSFHEEELHALERVHDAAQVAEAYQAARSAGFENVNLDLIYGLAGQTLDRWADNLERALALAPDHLSLYALTLEEGTALTRDVARGRVPAPDPDLQAEMFEWSRRRLAEAGFQHYEVSNWARPGRRCRHNLAYWRNGDWLGLGPGAHSHLFGRRFAAASTPSRYIALVREAAAAGASSLDGMPQLAELDPPDPAREMAETVILGLRLREGLDLAAFEARFGLSLDHVFPDALRETLDLGLTEQAAGRLRLRDEAVLLGDEAFLRFLHPSPY
jgi:oxygen-independent coproporphyrinogen-3 oxidase